MYMNLHTVNQQILAAVKFAVSQNKVIWRLLNLASPRLCSVRCRTRTGNNRTITYFGATYISENTQFTKYNSTPKFVALQHIYTPKMKNPRTILYE